MTNEVFDDFLNDSTHTVADEWARISGDTLSTDEKYALNDVLTAFFGAYRQKEPA